MSDKAILKENEKLDKQIEKLVAESAKAIEDYNAFMETREQEFNKNVVEEINSYCNELKKVYDDCDATFAKKTGVTDED
ncbi:MAG: hypothetical protein IKI95_05370 [Clostridia bacterium]|nr:hypothetical protein [Clostridia bacterium]